MYYNHFTQTEGAHVRVDEMLADDERVRFAGQLRPVLRVPLRALTAGLFTLTVFLVIVGLFLAQSGVL